MNQFEVFANEHIQELMGVDEEAARKVLRAHSRRQSFKASPEDKKKKDRKLSLLDTKGNDNNPL